jgi:hypothetical protein
MYLGSINASGREYWALETGSHGQEEILFLLWNPLERETRLDAYWHFSHCRVWVQFMWLQRGNVRLSA